MSGNGPGFFQTGMGHRFYEGTMPALVEQLKRLNSNLEKFLEIREKAFGKSPGGRVVASCSRCLHELDDSGLCSNKECSSYNKKPGLP